MLSQTFPELVKTQHGHRRINIPYCHQQSCYQTFLCSYCFDRVDSKLQFDSHHNRQSTQRTEISDILADGLASITREDLPVTAGDHDGERRAYGLEDVPTRTLMYRNIFCLSGVGTPAFYPSDAVLVWLGSDRSRSVRLSFPLVGAGARPLRRWDVMPSPLFAHNGIVAGQCSRWWCGANGPGPDWCASCPGGGIGGINKIAATACLKAA